MCHENTAMVLKIGFIHSLFRHNVICFDFGEESHSFEIQQRTQLSTNDLSLLLK